MFTWKLSLKEGSDAHLAAKSSSRSSSSLTSSGLGEQTSCNASRDACDVIGVMIRLLTE